MKARLTRRSLRAFAFLSCASCVGGNRCAPAKPASHREVVVVAVDPGSSAVEIEANDVRPLEARLASVPGVGKITSSASQGSAEIHLSLAHDEDQAAVMAAARERVGAARATLPSGANLMLLAGRDADEPLLRYVLEGGTLPFSALDAIEEQVRTGLEPVSGVAGVVACGTRDTEALVEVDGARADAMETSLADVAGAIRPGGPDRAPGIAGLASLPIAPRSGVRPPGAVVRVRDLATVSIGEAQPRCIAARGSQSGRFAPVIVADVRSQDLRPQDRDRALAAVRTQMAARAAALPPGVRLEIIPAEARVLHVLLATPPDARSATEIVAKITEAARMTPGVESAFGRLPLAGGQDSNAVDLLIVAARPAEADAVANAVAMRVEESPAVRYGGAMRERTLLVEGGDLDVIERTAAALATALSQASGVQRAFAEIPLRQPRIDVEIDRPRAADLGVSASEISATLAGAIQGLDAGTLVPDGGGEPVRVRVTLGGSSKTSPALDASFLSNVSVHGVGGRFVKMSEVARFVAKDEPSSIHHAGMQRAVTIRLRLRDGVRPSSGLDRDITTIAAKTQMPAGVTVKLDE